MSKFATNVLRNGLPLACAGSIAAIGRSKLFADDATDTCSERKRENVSWPGARWLPLLSDILPTSHTQMDSTKAYDHDPRDFDYYVSHPTVDDLPILLHKFDQDGLDVWPWIWTHPNENGPHHVFVGTTTLPPDVVHRIQQLRQASTQNNILIVMAGDESVLEQSARDAGVDLDVFDKCHCGIVTNRSVELLNISSKILMLDDERVVAFDYLTIC